MSNSKICLKGGCHCGAVEYEVRVGRQLSVRECNCSICSKSAYLHLIVSARDFHLLKGQDDLSEYRFNTDVARHLFCKHCGIKSFYVPRSHPDGFSVNVNCLDLPGEVTITVEEFDGQNWERNAAALAQLGKAN